MRIILMLLIWLFVFRWFTHVLLMLDLSKCEQLTIEYIISNMTHTKLGSQLYMCSNTPTLFHGDFFKFIEKECLSDGLIDDLV